MFHLFRAILDRLKVLLATSAALELEADALARHAERKAELLHLAQQYEADELPAVSLELRQHAEVLDFQQPLAGVAIDRLDGILDGLDAALAGAVQEAVEQAVKQAVQAVLTEVLTNRKLQEQLQQAAQPAPLPEPPHAKKNTANRLWQATTESMQRTVQSVKKMGRGVGLALLAAGGVVADVVYAARLKIVSLATTVYRYGKRLVQGAISALANMLPSFAFGG